MQVSFPFTPTQVAELIVLACAGVYWLYAFVVLYHLARFGVGVAPRQAAVLFLLGTVSLFSLALLALPRL